MTEYLFPTCIEDVIQCLDRYEGEARVIAGGTDVMADLRKGKIAPRCLVDITRVSGLDQIRVSDGAVEIGAAVTFADIKDSAFLNQRVHALTDAARSVGAIGIQTAATWVGNLVQAMPAADGAIIAFALEAQARVVDRHGAQWHAVESLFAGPGRSTVEPTRQLVTHVRFPVSGSATSGGWGTAWRRVGRRPSLVLPILNCAATIRLENGRIAHATIALGPVAPRPFRAREAEAFLRGQPPTTDCFERAAQIVQRASNPRSSVKRASREYRLAITPTLVSTALTTAAERAGSKA